MASHRAVRSRRRAVGRRRASSAAPTRRGTVLAAAAALMIGLVLGGSQGTFAFWTDTDSVSAGTFTTGTLDLTVDGQQGAPTAYAETELALTKMVPGETVAATLTIRNAGDADFTWVPTITESGTLAPFLDVTLTRGAMAGAVDTTYPRQQGCSAGTSMLSGAVAPNLPVSSSITLCALVTLPATLGNEVQGLSGYTLTLGLAATQRLS